MTEIDLDAIQARAARLYERTATIDPNAHPDFGQLTDADVPALVAENRRLRAERDELRGKFADAAASLAQQIQRYGQRQREHNADREELEHLRAELARRVQCNDCGAVGTVFTGVDGLAYLDPSGQIGHTPAARSADV